MPRFLAARKSLLEEDDSDDDDDEWSRLHQTTTNVAWSNCDALFLPPTALRRAKDNDRLLPVPRFPSNRSLLETSLSSLSSATPPPTNAATPPKDLSLTSCSVGGKTTVSATAAVLSPVPLSIITAMNSRRRFSISRQGSLP